MRKVYVVHPNAPSIHREEGDVVFYLNKGTPKEESEFLKVARRMRPDRIVVVYNR